MWNDNFGRILGLGELIIAVIVVVVLWSVVAAALVALFRTASTGVSYHRVCERSRSRLVSADRWGQAASEPMHTAGASRRSTVLTRPPVLNEAKPQAADALSDLDETAGRPT